MMIAIAMLLALSQAALVDETVLKSFTPIAERYEKFFARPQYLVEKQLVSWAAPVGAYFVRQYLGSNVAYDVEKTTSLVSPYIAHVDVDFSSSLEVDKCGSLKVRGLKGWWGFKSADEANASIGQPQCEKSDGAQRFTDPVRFHFAFQGGRWVLKNAIRKRYGKPETSLLATISQVPVEPSIPVAANLAPANAGWATLREPPDADR